MVHQGAVQYVEVEEVPGVLVEVLREAGEGSVTVVVGEVVGAAEAEEADSVLAGAVVEDVVETPTSLNQAFFEGVGHRHHIGCFGALAGIAGRDCCTKYLHFLAHSSHSASLANCFPCG